MLPSLSLLRKQTYVRISAEIRADSLTGLNCANKGQSNADDKEDIHVSCFLSQETVD